MITIASLPAVQAGRLLLASANMFFKISRRRKKLGTAVEAVFCAEREALPSRWSEARAFLKNIFAEAPCPLGLRDGFLRKLLC
jgi:hypothetical protein